MTGREPLLLGIDVGTGSSKASLVTPAGAVVCSVAVPHGVEVPRPGWAEQDADEVWWGDVVHLCAELFTERGFDAAAIQGIGVSAIGPCLLPLDAADRPLRKGILYGVDTRATTQIKELEESIGTAAIRDLARMDLSSQAVGPKIAWLREEEPDVWRQAATLTTASAFLVHRLTGEHVMDHHTAAHSIPLYDPDGHRWTDRYSEGLTELGRLPRLAWADEQAGAVTAAAAAATGLREGTPVAVGTVDALSEAISVGAVGAGDLMLMYGSTAFMILHAEAPEPSPGMWLLPGAWEGTRTVAAGMATTGSLTKWFTEELTDLEGPDAFEHLFEGAATSPPGARGLLVLPYFAGERTPVNDPDARGVIAGLSLAHSRADLFRAVLEGVAFGIRHNLEAMEAAGAPIARVVAVGGGTSGLLWPQIVSDVAGVEQVIPRGRVGASVGDAFLGGVAAGILELADLAGWVEVERVLTPTPREEYEQAYGMFRELYPATADVVHRLAASG